MFYKGNIHTFKVQLHSFVYNYILNLYNLCSCFPFLLFTGVRLDKLGSDMMRADLTDNQFQRLHLSICLSVSEGVHHVYQQFSHSKWQQVSQCNQNFTKILPSLKLAL